LHRLNITIQQRLDTNYNINNKLTTDNINKYYKLKRANYTKPNNTLVTEFTIIPSLNSLVSNALD